MITLGIPTLNRYDLLETSIQSAERGEVKPDKYLIIDNGLRFTMNDFYASLGDRLQVLNFGHNTGCAGGWNKIITNSSDIRIIANDDVFFFEETIRELRDTFDEGCVTFPAGMPAANVFSCFVIPDNVVNRIGLFDEKISPNYAYFEDNDYNRRIVLGGLELRGINCRLGHFPSSTMKALTNLEQQKHHNKFKTAQDNYKRKWGGLPGHETRTTPKEL